MKTHTVEDRKHNMIVYTRDMQKRRDETIRRTHHCHLATCYFLVARLPVGPAMPNRRLWIPKKTARWLRCWSTWTLGPQTRWTWRWILRPVACRTRGRVFLKRKYDSKSMGWTSRCVCACERARAHVCVCVCVCVLGEIIEMTMRS